MDINTDINILLAVHRAWIDRSISDIVRSLGYTPIIAQEEDFERLVKSFPVAWIKPPKLIGVEGRDRGYMTHSIELTVMVEDKGYSPYNQTVTLRKLEEDMTSIFNILQHTDMVVTVESIKVSPSIKKCTKHNDISQSATAVVVSYFTRKS